MRHLPLAVLLAVPACSDGSPASTLDGADASSELDGASGIDGSHSAPGSDVDPDTLAPGTADSASAFDAATPIDSGVQDATGAGDGGCVPVNPPSVVKAGLPDKVLLRGMIVTPDVAFAGEVLVEGNLISCAAASCASSPGAVAATVVETHGIVLPGMIDTHNHILFDIFDETDWSPAQSYLNHTQWPADPRYRALADAKDYLNGQSASPVNFGCELQKYGEMKGLVAGTTSIAGASTGRACYESLARSIDTSLGDLGIGQKVQTSLLPSKASGDAACTSFSSGALFSFVVHVSEGVDTPALAEFATLGSVTTTPGCLYAPQTTIVHGVALGDTEFSTMASKGMSLTWSPRSNVFLYGAGTDLSKTANVPLAIAKGINVSIGPDWSIGGSQNLLDELRFADQVDNTKWGNILSAQTLVQMVTTHPAKALGLDAMIGSIAVGKRADLLVIGGDSSAPFDAVLEATPRDVRLVLVDGVARYGDVSLKALGPSAPGCEDIDICCSAKFACVAESGATEKIGQTFAEISSVLARGLSDYDALSLTQYKFSPVTPVVRCR